MYIKLNVIADCFPGVHLHFRQGSTKVHLNQSQHEASELDYFHISSPDIRLGTLRHERRPSRLEPIMEVVCSFHGLYAQLDNDHLGNFQEISRPRRWVGGEDELASRTIEAQRETQRHREGVVVWQQRKDRVIHVRWSRPGRNGKDCI
jgi:hypothetical protein